MSHLIHFDSLVLEDENDTIKQRLYDLFFVWRGSTGQTALPNEEECESPITRSKDQTEEDRIERQKRALLKRDQAMQSFQDRGGFTRVLNDIFNPEDRKSLELDSVFQIK